MSAALKILRCKSYNGKRYLNQTVTGLGLRLHAISRSLNRSGSYHCSLLVIYSSRLFLLIVILLVDYLHNVLPVMQCKVS